MAQKVHVQLIDDVSGEPADETVRFEIDGVSYEIDLTEVNAARLRETLGEWVNHGRRVGGRRRTRTSTSTSTSDKSARRADLAQIRAWAREAGHEISDRGRIATSIVEAYDAAHPAA